MHKFGSVPGEHWYTRTPAENGIRRMQHRTKNALHKEVRRQSNDAKYDPRWSNDDVHLNGWLNETTDKSNRRCTCLKVT
uniref:Uncharacterized protein n=1 Tax=Anopheles albimanus TaxID=7167 RepID=A0A182FX78_ANOAL